jgi:hypothetical protein
VAPRRARSKQVSRRVTIIGVALVIVAIANFVIYAARKVVEGHGLDLYITGSGAKMSYISAVVLFAILPIVLGAAWVWSRWSKGH